MSLSFRPAGTLSEKEGSGINFDFERQAIMKTPEYLAQTPRGREVMLQSAEMCYWFCRKYFDEHREAHRQEVSALEVHEEQLRTIARILKEYAD